MGLLQEREAAERPAWLSLHLHGRQEWTLWPPTTRFLALANGVVVLMLLCGGWSWQQLRLAGAVLLASVLPVSSHVLVLLATLPFWTAPDGAEWPLLGRTQVAALAVMHLLLLKLASPRLQPTTRQRRHGDAFLDQLRWLQLVAFGVWTVTLAATLAVLVRRPDDPWALKWFPICAFGFYVSSVLLGLSWSMLYLRLGSVIAAPLALLKAPSRYATWALALSPHPPTDVPIGVAMLLESVRMVHSALRGLFPHWYRPGLHHIPLATAAVETAVFCVWWARGREYPSVLWLRLPQLVQACLLLQQAVRDARLANRREWVDPATATTTVRLFECVASEHAPTHAQVTGVGAVPRAQSDQGPRRAAPLRRHSHSDSESYTDKLRAWVASTENVWGSGPAEEGPEPGGSSEVPAGRVASSIRGCSRQAPALTSPKGETLTIDGKKVPGRWRTGEARVRLESAPMVVASPGSMRELCRLEDPDGALGLDSMRCVAKRYTRASLEHIRRNGGVGNEVYFRDVHMQFVAKAWARAFNNRLPPKAVEMIPAVVVAVQHPGTLNWEYFAVERFIGAAFEKYNSNHFTPQLLFSERTRETPDAYSHFTFHQSGHQLLVADIQGVGNVFTDPQILTVGESDDKGHFGVGNTATDGIKLWFASHRCRGVCKSLGLTHPFPNELEEGLTHVRGLSHLKLLLQRVNSATRGLNTQLNTSVAEPPMAPTDAPLDCAPASVPADTAPAPDPLESPIPSPVPSPSSGLFRRNTFTR